MTTTPPLGAAHYIESAADQGDLLGDAVDSGDPGYIAYPLGAVARARGRAHRRGTGDRRTKHEAM